MQETNYEEFETLFRLHHKELINLAYNLLRDKDAAKDVVQEVFFKLWKNKSELTFGEKIKHYLFKATAHTALNHLRLQNRLSTLDESTKEHLVAPTDREEVSYKELEIKVREAIDHLPPRCKAIYILSRHEGLKYQEIADTLHLSLKTVENQMGIALEKLRQELKPFLSLEFLSLGILLAGLTLLYYFL